MVIPNGCVRVVSKMALPMLISTFLARSGVSIELEFIRVIAAAVEYGDLD
jgi:mannose/fructose-specific phosphotransferase system component IIA